MTDRSSVMEDIRALVKKFPDGYEGWERNKKIRDEQDNSGGDFTR